MTAHSLSTLSLVLLLFPLAYYLITSPAFLLVRLDAPQVRSLMRSHFNGYLLWLRIAAAVATVALGAAGRPVLAGLAAGLAVAAVLVRRWLLARIDVHMTAHELGDGRALRRLRGLHVGAMLGNAAVLGCVVTAVNRVLAIPG